MTRMGEWDISAFISERVGRYDVQYMQTGLGGRAVYHVKGVICERDVYSILEVTHRLSVSEYYLYYLYVLVY